MSDLADLYQELILEHHQSPRNFGVLEPHSHQAVGFNPLCGDHLHVTANLENDCVKELKFQGSGCAISRASASMMTQSLKGKNVAEAATLFEEFHKLVTGQLDPDKEANHLGKLSIFSGIWHFPARVKCAILSWHTVKGALDRKKDPIKTE